MLSTWISVNGPEKSDEELMLYCSQTREGSKILKRITEGPQIEQVSVHACAATRQFVKFLIKTSLKWFFAHLSFPLSTHPCLCVAIDFTILQAICLKLWSAFRPTCGWLCFDLSVGYFLFSSWSSKIICTYLVFRSHAVVKYNRIPTSVKISGLD